jgi:ribonuclease H / adenosylcobalamin/alpha-ribazole phosphatase
MLTILKKLRDRLTAGERVSRAELIGILEEVLGESKASGLRAGVLYADGGSRGNPGPAAYGAALFDADGGELARRAARIGRATNNVAEYRGLLAGLELARELGLSELTVRLDSQLVVRQMTGRYKAKNAALRELRDKARELAAGFQRVSYQHIPREANRLADALANAALDDRDPEGV